MHGRIDWSNTKKTENFSVSIDRASIEYQLSQATQTLNTFCIKIKEHIILDGHNKITHNIVYQVLQRVTCVVCATSKSLRYMWGDMWIAINHNFYKIHHIEFERGYHLKSYIT